MNHSTPPDCEPKSTSTLPEQPGVLVVRKHHFLVSWSHWLSVPILLGLILSGISIYWASPIYQHKPDPNTGNTDVVADIGVWICAHVPGLHHYSSPPDWIYNHMSFVHTRCVHHLRRKLDCPTLGQSATGTSQNCRGRALATSDRSSEWYSSEDKVRDVGFVFARREVGVLWQQSHRVGHTCRKRGEARSQHRRADQCQTSEFPFGLVRRTGQNGPSGVGISGSASRVSRRSFRNTSRGTWGSALARLRFRKHELQPATLVLLASRWASEVHQNRSIGEAVADASKPETCLAGVEVSNSLQPTRAFHLSFGKTDRQQGTRSGVTAQHESPTCVQEDRHHRRGLAHFSAHGWNRVGGDGRTPAHNPRLLAAQQPSCHEQVPAGDIEDQTLGTGQIGRRDFADGYFAEDKPNPMNAVCERFRMGPFSSGAYRPPNIP